MPQADDVTHAVLQDRGDGGDENALVARETERVMVIMRR